MIRVTNATDTAKLAKIYTLRFGETRVRAMMVVGMASCRDQGLLTRSAADVRKWRIHDVPAPITQGPVSCPNPVIREGAGVTS